MMQSQISDAMLVMLIFVITYVTLNIFPQIYLKSELSLSQDIKLS